MVQTKLYGGLGNTLFQIANCISYSLKHKMDYCIPTTITNPHYEGQKVFRSPNINYCDKELNLPVWKEPHFHYAEIPAMKDVCLDGYFQSHKYIEPHRAEVLKILRVDNIQTMEGVCSIHQRAGDYKLYPTMHPVISNEYLIESITRMKNNGYYKFLVFSDDIPEIKKIIKDAPFSNRLSFEYSEGKTEEEDLRLMGSCESNITANSSFSWWGAYINPNPNKIIVMTRNWFGKDLNHDTKDLYLPGSIII